MAHHLLWYSAISLSLTPSLPPPSLSFPLLNYLIFLLDTHVGVFCFTVWGWSCIRNLGKQDLAQPSDPFFRSPAYIKWGLVSGYTSLLSSPCGFL